MKEKKVGQSQTKKRNVDVHLQNMSQKIITRVQQQQQQQTHHNKSINSMNNKTNNKNISSHNNRSNNHTDLPTITSSR